MRYAALLLLLAAPCHAQEWTTTDTAYEAAYLVLHTADWSQTRYISKHCDQFEEGNGILGDCPSVGRVDCYFLATGLLHIGVAHILPPDWRRGFQLVTISVEAGAVAHNYKLGIRMAF